MQERLAGVAGALAAVREQVAGQANSLADLKAAESEMRRVLADKAGLADVQAVLQAQSAPALVPVRTPVHLHVPAHRHLVKGAWFSRGEEERRGQLPVRVTDKQSAVWSTGTQPCLRL